MRVAAHPLPLHHLSSPFNHLAMQSQSLHWEQDALRGCIHFTCCCCLQPECNDWEIEVTEVYDIFMMSRGVGLLGHWQQRNCYSRVFSLRHSSTIRIQWGGPKYCSRPCTPDAAGLRLKSSHVGPPELLQPFFRGLAGQLSPACCSLASLGWSQQPPQTRRQLQPLPGPGLSLVSGAAPRSQSQAGMMARDVAAVPGPSTGNMMHSARETPREIKRRAVCDGTITYNSPAVAKHFREA